MTRTDRIAALFALALCAQPMAGHAAAPASGAAKATESYRPALPNEITVSDRDFNHFVFPAAITNGPIFPAGSPLLGKPVYLSSNTQLLIQVASGADTPFHMIVELENGAVYKFYLRPRPIPGITHRVDGASERTGPRRVASAADTGSAGAAPRGADVELLKRVVSGRIPEEFMGIELPPPARFDKFTVVPLTGWSDGDMRRVMVFSLVAVPGQTAVVAPPQFYRPGITAVMIDGDVVDANNSPTLYVVEEILLDE